VKKRPVAFLESRARLAAFRELLASTDGYSKSRSEVKGIPAMHRCLLSSIGRILIEARRCPALIARR
jgi:hypothetical protein